MTNGLRRRVAYWKLREVVEPAGKVDGVDTGEVEKEVDFVR